MLILLTLFTSPAFSELSVEEIIKGRQAIFSENYKTAKRVQALSSDIEFEAAIELMNKMSEKKRMPVCFNRKEIKDHGEGGMLIGAKPKGKVLIVDDVLSSGLAISESVNFLSFYDVEIVGALVTLNRLEKGLNTDNTASGELELKGINIFQIISLDDLLEADELISKENAKKMKFDLRKQDHQKLSMNYKCRL